MGVIRVCDILLSKAEPRGGQTTISPPKTEASQSGRPSRFYQRLGKIRNRLGEIDYRLVAVGSLLPDILDKPIFLLFGKFLPLSGRGYAHTLLFNLILLIGGMVLIRFRKSWLLVLSVASLMHLVLDRIWVRPVVLLYPVLGSIPSGETTGWFERLFSGFFSHPEEWVWEILGLAIILFLGYKLIKKKAIIAFIKKGTLV